MGRSVRISTTIREDLHREARINNVSWAEALEIGVRTLIKEPVVLASNEKVEYMTSKAIDLNKIRTLQQCIDDLNDKLEGKK